LIAINPRSSFLTVKGVRRPGAVGDRPDLRRGQRSLGAGVKRVVAISGNPGDEERCEDISGIETLGGACVTSGMRARHPGGLLRKRRRIRG